MALERLSQNAADGFADYGGVDAYLQSQSDRLAQALAEGQDPFGDATPAEIEADIRRVVNATGRDEIGYLKSLDYAPASTITAATDAGAGREASSGDDGSYSGEYADAYRDLDEMHQGYESDAPTGSYETESGERFHEEGQHVGWDSYLGAWLAGGDSGGENLPLPAVAALGLVLLILILK